MPHENDRTAPPSAATDAPLDANANANDASTTTPRIPVFLDCDTGIDDAMALAYLLNSDDARVVGIGTVSGNTDAAQAATNTAVLLGIAGRGDIPVAVGEHHFLEEEFGGGSPHVHGVDGMGDVAFDTPARTAVSTTHAAELLYEAARAHPGSLRVVAIGPLTNLAVALERHPDLPGLVHSVTVMGGAALAPGNVTPVAEANIWHDPAAAARVLDADWRVRLVPLDVTMTHVMSESDRMRLLESPDALARFVGAALDFYFDFYVGHFGARSAALHDPLAAAIALDHVALDLEPVVPIVVDTTDGPGRGQTICDLRGRYRGFSAAGTSDEARSSGPDVTTSVVLSATTDFTAAIIDRIAHDAR